MTQRKQRNLCLFLCVLNAVLSAIYLCMFALFRLFSVCLHFEKRNFFFFFYRLIVTQNIDNESTQPRKKNDIDEKVREIFLNKFSKWKLSAKQNTKFFEQYTKI